jgi:hypothetical protein
MKSASYGTWVGGICFLEVVTKFPDFESTEPEEAFFNSDNFWLVPLRQKDWGKHRRKLQFTLCPTVGDREGLEAPKCSLA